MFQQRIVLSNIKFSRQHIQSMGILIRCIYFWNFKIYEYKFRNRSVAFGNSCQKQSSKIKLNSIPSARRTCKKKHKIGRRLYQTVEIQYKLFIV